MKKFFIKIWDAIDLKNYWQLYLMTILVTFILLLLFGVLDLPSILNSFVKENSI